MDLILTALIKKYESDKATALAQLNLLMTKAVGISSHTQIILECDTYLQQISNAEEKLKTLNGLIQKANDNESN